MLFEGETVGVERQPVCPATRARRPEVVVMAAVELGQQGSGGPSSLRIGYRDLQYPVSRFASEARYLIPTGRGDGEVGNDDRLARPVGRGGLRRGRRPASSGPSTTRSVDFGLTRGSDRRFRPRHPVVARPVVLPESPADYESALRTGLLPSGGGTDEEATAVARALIGRESKRSNEYDKGWSPAGGLHDDVRQEGTGSAFGQRRSGCAGRVFVLGRATPPVRRAVAALRGVPGASAPPTAFASGRPGLDYTFRALTVGLSQVRSRPPAGCPNFILSGRIYVSAALASSRRSPASSAFRRDRGHQRPRSADHADRDGRMNLPDFVGHAGRRAGRRFNIAPPVRARRFVIDIKDAQKRSGASRFRA